MIPIRWYRCGHVRIADRKKHRCCPVCRKDLSPSIGVSKAQARKHIAACRARQAEERDHAQEATP